jgi:hypothetical protein
MNNISTEKFNKLMEDKAFVEKMLGQETQEDVQKLFAENGVEMTMEEVGQLGETLNKCFDKLGDELDESALEDVSGGFFITLGAGVTGWAVAKAVIGIGAAGLAIYKWYKSR